MAFDSVGKFAVPKLGMDNYATWKPKMKFLLITKDLWQPVDAGSTGDEDNKALALIGLHVEDYHLNMVGQCSSAKEAWEALEAVYTSTSIAQCLHPGSGC